MFIWRAITKRKKIRNRSLEKSKQTNTEKNGYRREREVDGGEGEEQLEKFRFK